MGNDRKENNLEERFKKFFERVIRLGEKIPINPLTRRPLEQLAAAAGSVGANYCEAQSGLSRKDFIKSIKISRKEAKECTVWLRGLKAAVDFDDPEFDNLVQEANEFTYIFTSILEKVDKK